MKYIKCFEEVQHKLSYTREPIVGDYILVKDNEFFRRLGMFNNIGVIMDIMDNGSLPYDVEFENMLSDGSYGNLVGVNGILYWSDKREDLEFILKSGKFNL